MRYILDSDGYVEELSCNEIECNNKTCTEYTGTIPSGYTSLIEWVENANIRAYKIVGGNLTYDAARDTYLQNLYEQEAEDNRHLIKKDLYAIEEKINQNDSSLKERYQTTIANGKIAILNNAISLSPNIKITNIEPYSYEKINLIATKKNMLPNTAYSQTINGISFIQNEDRSITINGTATADIEYNIAGDSTSTIPILCIKKDTDYYLNTGGYVFKMYSYDGTDRSQTYEGNGGLINTNNDIIATQIVLSIASGTTINETIYPQLELGTSASEYEMHEEYTLEIDFNEYIGEGLFPSDTLYPSDNLFPKGTTIEDIFIYGEKISIKVNGINYKLSDGYLKVFNDYTNIYAIQDTNLEVEYYTNTLTGDFAGRIFNNDYKLLGEHGLLTNLQFVSASGNTPLGWYYDGDYHKMGIDIPYSIPANFTIVEAYITLFHVPCYSELTTSDGTNNYWCYSQNIELYKMNNENLYFPRYGWIGMPYYGDIENASKIDGAMGTSGWTATAPTDSSHDAEFYNSKNIAASLTTGENGILILKTNETTPSSEVNSLQKTGQGYAVLNVIGYMKYGKEE